MLYFIIQTRHIPVSVKKHSSREEDPGEEKPPEYQIGGWRAVSASGLQGKGSPKMSAYFTDPSIMIIVYSFFPRFH